MNICKNIIHMKNKILISLLLLVMSCSNLPFEKKQKNDIHAPHNKQLALLWLLYAPHGPHNCSFPAIPNAGYPVTYKLWMYNTNQYPIITAGDSTFAISSSYAGWLNSNTTVSVAVVGNTLCDMVDQIVAINAKSPNFIIVSTMGGNDYLQFSTQANVISTAQELIDKLNSTFPNTKIILVGLHPSLNSYANANKDASNTAISAYLTANIPAARRCFYDPMPLFGVGVGQAAPASMMMDSVHYNFAMSFSIKYAIQTNCMSGQSF